MLVQWTNPSARSTSAPTACFRIEKDLDAMLADQRVHVGAFEPGDLGRTRSLATGDRQHSGQIRLRVRRS